MLLRRVVGVAEESVGDGEREWEMEWDEPSFYRWIDCGWAAGGEPTIASRESKDHEADAMSSLVSFPLRFFGSY